jgi:phage-related protein (TIGR01555 family)
MRRPVLKKGIATRDSFTNLQLRLGNSTDTAGNPLNQMSGGTYLLNPVSRLRIVLDYAYRGSWIVRRCIDTVAEDMTRAGINIESGYNPKQKEEIGTDLESKGIWKSLRDAIRWGRLYGGCIAFMMIDGQDPEEPLDVDSVGKDDFLGLFIVDRWMCQPTLGDLVTDPGPYMGLPRFYDVVVDGNGLPTMRMHYSRCIRFEGHPLPYFQRQAENMWSNSIFEAMWDRLIAFDSTTMGVAQLVFKAHLRTYKLPNFRELVAEGGPMLNVVMEQVAMIRQFESFEGMSVIDAEDEMVRDSYTFAGLSDVMIQFAQQMSGAADVPMVRLFGQSPAGLNSTGDADLVNHYDMLNGQQEAKLRPGMTTMFAVQSRSMYGRALPKDFRFTFNPLWQMRDQEKAEVDAKDSNSVVTVFNAGIISQKIALQELKARGRVTGRWQSITDEVINAADDEIPSPNMLAGTAGGAEGDDGTLVNPGGGNTTGKKEPGDDTVKTSPDNNRPDTA